MPRHFLSEPAVRPLVRELVAVVLHESSVNAAHRKLTSVLAADKSEGWIYPNRLHLLLSADSSRAINSDTLAVLRLALSRLPDALRDPDGAPALSAGRRAEALRAWEATADGVEARDETARLLATAERLSLPPAVTLWLLDDIGVDKDRMHLDDTSKLNGHAHRDDHPDWSFQDVAYMRCVNALASGPGRKVGLVLPTGAGKTRVAIRIALTLLDAERDDTVVLWVTHRLRLKTQAHRELQRAMNEGTPNLPEGAARLLGQRVEFCMLSDLGRRLPELYPNVALVIIDEAHHAAAASYQTIFDHRPLRGLFLTATPNRTDALPIGIDEIAYTITSRELFDRHVILEPHVETLDLFDFAWDDSSELRDLADWLLDRAQGEFTKTLVAVSTVEHAISLYTALVSVLEDDAHQEALTVDDLGFVHGAGSSTGDRPDVFFDEFAARPRGIVIATTQLISEGFDDPSINAVVVTYRTTSMLQLMQVAGRCLRSAPGKHTAHVVQMRDSPLVYHWEQRWLYQDISDALRPQLGDREYSSIEDLVCQIDELLSRAHVRTHVASAVRTTIAQVQAGEQVALLMTGLPYGGRRDLFDEKASWHAVAVTDATRDIFLPIFNGFSSRETAVNDFDDYLCNFIRPDPAPAGPWKLYKDILWGMSYAHRELTGESYDGAGSRPYNPGVGTTWLRYITFRYAPRIPSALDGFLGDAINRDVIVSEYLRSPRRFALAIKVPLPLAGTIAFLLDEAQSEWLASERSILRSRLEDVASQALGVLVDWRCSLLSSPVPLAIVDQIDRFLRTEDLTALTLNLAAEDAALGLLGDRSDRIAPSHRSDF